MKRSPAHAFASLLILAIALPGTSAGQSQSEAAYRPPSSYPGAGQPSAPQGLVHALWTPGDRPDRAVRFSDYVDAYGNSVVVPASYSAPFARAACSGCGGAGCAMCGGTGCGPCNGPPCGYPGGPGVYGPCPPPGASPPFGYNDDMADLIGAGSLGIDQCGPHYFDARAEAVYLTRDETFGPDTVFSHNGLTALIGGEPVFVDIALQSGQLEYDDEPGFRIIGRYDLGPLSVFEFGYMGVFDYSAAATFDDSPGGGNPSPDDLFSIWSLYGNNPLNAEQPAGTDVMRQSEKARTHSISIKSDLQSVEMTYRRYWVGYVPKLSGTVFAGARYTRLSEQFNFFSQGAPNNGSLSYDIDAENQLAGFQTGLDMWVCVTQGLRIGVEGKTGIYNNRYKLDNEITQVQAAVDPNRETILAVFPERFRGDQVAFLSEASVDVVVDVLPSWSIRGGYEVLFMNSLVLAGANFNGGSPYQGFGQPRTAFIENQGKAFFHGIHLGAEYIW